MTNNHQQNGGNLIKFSQQETTSAVKSDQDLLNAVVTVSDDLTFSIMGKEGMGFNYPVYLMSHALGIKPWKKNFIKHLFVSGQRPTVGDVSYVKYANHPIKPMSSLSFFLKKINLKFSLMLGRIFG